MNILLVEDSDSDALMIAEALKNSHQRAEIIRAKTLDECLHQVRRGGVDMVLLDLGLPDTTGIHALSEIVALEKHMPIVIITGDDRRESLAQAAQMGAKDYIIKHRMNEKRIVDAVAYVKREIERGDKLQRGRKLIEDSLQSVTTNAKNILDGNHAIAHSHH